MTDLVERIEFDIATLPAQDAYKLLVGAIVPRPIAWVSTLSAAGTRNLAPFSFFNGICGDPMALSFSVMRRGAQGERKDTLNNIEATGEFVVNLPDEALAERMNVTAGEYPSEIDEFEKAGLTPVASSRIKPPRVAESPINFECKLIQIVHLGEGRPMSGSLIIGEVVYAHIRENLLAGAKIDPTILRPIGRMGGPSYTRAASDLFDMVRPKV